MSEVDESYELKVLKMIVNKYLDETISPTEESLNELEYNCDQVVWELATKIYSQSGHKVQLSLVRDIVDSRIKIIKCQIAAEKERIAEQASHAAAEKERIATEEACRLAEKYPHFQNQVNQVLGKFGGDESKAKVFVRVRKVISDNLEVDQSKVSLDSHLLCDLGADELDLVGLVMDLEEEFNIEISDEDSQNYYVKNFVELIYKKVSD